MYKTLLAATVGLVLTFSITGCGILDSNGNDVNVKDLPRSSSLPSIDPTLTPKQEKAVNEGATKAAKVTKEAAKAAEKKAKEYQKYLNSPEGKAASKKLVDKGEKAAKELGGAVGDYLKNLP